MSSLTSALSKATELLWKIAEIGFVANLVIILVYILLGETSGNFVISVVANVILLTLGETNDPLAIPSPAPAGLNTAILF